MAGYASVSRIFNAVKQKKCFATWEAANFIQILISEARSTLSDTRVTIWTRILDVYVISCCTIVALKDIIIIAIIAL